MENSDKNVSTSRRSFLKVCAAAGISASFPLKSVFAGGHVKQISSSEKKRNSGCLLKFGQITDVHIGDVANPIRADLLGGVIAFFYARPQDSMSPKILDSTIESVNTYSQANDFDFCIATGDLIDMSMKREVRWLVDICDGRPPQNYRVDEMIEVNNPHGFDLPWYACMGNHDLLLFGALPSKLIEYLILNININPDFDIINQDEWIDAVKGSTTPVYGHGFYDQPPKEDGYYSFSPNENTHCIVLHTTADNHMEGLADIFLSERQGRVLSILRQRKNPYAVFNDLVKDFSGWIENESLTRGLDEKLLSRNRGMFGDLNAVFAIGSSGTLDQDQYRWMKNEIESNQDKLCLIFSHHGSCDFMNIAGNVSGSEFDETICSYKNVIAHVCGHSHENKIDNISSGSGSYYRLRTSSIIEYPQEWRSFEVSKLSADKGILKTKVHRHQYRDGFVIASGHWRILWSKSKMYGETDDRDIELEFEIPEKVKDGFKSVKLAG